MKKTVVTLFALILVAVFALSGCGGGSSAPQKETKNSWEKIVEKGVFVLGMDEAFPPMGYRDEKGVLVGFDVDVAKEVMSRLGIELKLQPINWSAKEQELDTGKIDAIWNGFTITDARKNLVLFTEPYMNNRQVLVVKIDADFAELADLSDKKLGLQAGSSANDALDKKPEFKASLKEVVSFDDNMTAFLDLEKGGIDVLLIDEIVARYYITLKPNTYKLLDQELAREEFGIGFRKNDTELMQKVQDTLKEMAADGKLAEISIEWFSEDITTIK